MKRTMIAIIVVAVLVLLLVLLFRALPDAPTDNGIPPGNGTSTENGLPTPTSTDGATSTDNGASGSPTSSDNGSAMVSRVRIAVLDTEQTTQGEERGCDRVAFITRDIEPTTAPLTAAMEELFSMNQETVSGFYNFMARTNETLSFDRATVENGTANIYLTGRLSGLAGVCDNPRTQIQIEETAMQFPTVDRVRIFLNNEETDLTPSERG